MQTSADFAENRVGGAGDQDLHIDQGSSSILIKSFLNRIFAIFILQKNH
ncbi:hypothetical protein SynMITS9220_01150 [Synechococcus sp. MIT S9220]|nr:hypothetical protein SynMITS9220_01150 [Synechococcus sp. MIT S9220]